MLDYMKIYLFNPEKARGVQEDGRFPRSLGLIVGALLLTLPLMGLGGFTLARYMDAGMVPADVRAAWERRLADQQSELARVAGY